MQALRQQTEQFFEWWSEFVVRFRWLVLIATLIITPLIVYQIKHGWMDLSIESYLPQDDLAVQNYNEFRNTYGYDNPGMLSIYIPDGVFTLEALGKIKALHEAIDKRVPYVNEITSLVNVRHTRGDDDTLHVDDLIELWPETEADMPAFKELVLSNPNYVGSLISADGKYTTVVIEPNVYSNEYLNGVNGGDNIDDLMSGFDDGFDDAEADAASSADKEEQPHFIKPEEETEFSRVVIEIRDEFRSDDFVIRGAGGPIMNFSLAKDMEISTTQSTGLALLVIGFLLIFLFRRLSGVLMPLLVVMMSVMVTMAMWPILGYAFNGNTSIVPTFLLAVGIADAVHVLSLFYRRYDAGEEKHKAIAGAMKQTSIAILMTTVTTAASLLSFLSGEMVPTRTLGIFGAIGVVMALIYTIVLLPALLAIMPVKRRKLESMEEGSISVKESGLLAHIDRYIDFCGRYGVRHAKAVVAFCAVVGVVALAGVAQVTFSHDPVSWYPEDAEFRVAINTVDENMDGSMTVQLMIDTNKEGALYEPEVLRLFERMEDKLKSYSYEGIQAKEVTSILSVVKENHKALNGNDEAYYVIPDDRLTIRQEMLLFENSGADDLEDFTNGTFSKARFTVQMPWYNVIHYRGYSERMTAELDALVADSGLGEMNIEMEAKLVGLLMIFGRSIQVLLWGTVSSYMIAFALVFILMFMLMGSIRRGLLAFSPNIIPILITVGIMGWAGIPINMFTAMIGCIIIGISVDDTIHFMHHFRTYSLQKISTEEAVHKTLQTCGRAITFTSVVLIGGFLVFLFDQFLTSKQFGFFLSIAIFAALMANLILAPALMTLFWDRGKEQAQTV